MADRAELLCICGPTASGKTALAIQLAKQLDGEVISADSMQIYQGLRIGTAAPDEDEMQGVPHHLLGVLPPDVPFSAADYVALAAKAVEDVAARGKTPILCGGTGLYLQTFLEGVKFSEQENNHAVRIALQQELAQQGAQALYARLCRLDPQGAKAIHPNNHVRVLRALELLQATGLTAAQRAQVSKPGQAPYKALVIALGFADRARLYARIDNRVDMMMKAGLLQEAARVYRHKDTWQGAARAIGYKELFPFLEDKAPLDECVAQLKQASRRYAKRQITWFRHMTGVLWLDAEDAALRAKALKAWQDFTKQAR